MNYALSVGFENGRLVRVTLRAADNSGHEQVNTFHYDLNNHGDPQTNDPQSLADIFRDDVRPQWATFFRSYWTLDPVYIVDEKDPQNPLAPRSSWQSGAPIAGTSSDSSELLPPGCCGLAKVASDKIGRRFNGRLFIAGSFGEGAQSGGVWSGAYQAGFNTWLDAIPRQPDIAGPGSTATANWCVYSRTQRAANLDPYAEHVSAATLRTKVHFLRRRAQY